MLCALLLVSACTPGRDLAPLQPVPTSAYRLGPGDRVRIIVFGDQQLTSDFRVSDSGTVAVPLLGTVQAAGLTPSGLSDQISAELRKRKLFSNPSVVAEVVEYRPIFVLGEVNRPGQYPYQPGMSVLTAVAVAGGFTYRAVEDRASVLRNDGEQQPVRGLAQPESQLRPGDVVTIFERMF
jgi:polysaccharide export outer membrane protein